MLCDMGRLTIVIPVLDEAAIIAAALQALAPLRGRGAEVIVVDGGSSDGTAALAHLFADRVIAGPRNRGAALNAGAALGSGEVFVFLHADTTLPDRADQLIAAALACRPSDRACRRHWGRFDLRIAGRHRRLSFRDSAMSSISGKSGKPPTDQNALRVTKIA